MTSDLVTTFLLIVLAASGIGMVLLGIFYAVFGPSTTQDRLHNFVTHAAEERLRRPEDEHSTLNQMRSRLKDTLSIFSSRELQLKISSAYWPIYDTEFILIRFAATVLGAIIGWLIPRSILGGLGVGFVFYLVPGFILNRSIFLRQKVFQDQLIDVLVLIKGAVQSGYSLLQALDVVIDEMVAPASEEFGRVVREVQFGLPLTQALLNLSNRMESDDLHLIVTSVIINSEVGGNLTTMLDAVTNTIRDRIYMFGEIRASTSYARYTGNFLTLLPFLTFLVIYLINPGYFDGVWDNGISRVIFIIAAINMVLGNIWLRRIVRIDI